MGLADLGISKDCVYFLFWSGFGIFTLANFWLGVYLIVKAIKDTAGS